MSQSSLDSVLREDWTVRLSKTIREGFQMGKIVVIGIGNPLKSDDYVGSLIAKDLSSENGSSQKVTIVDAENSPENTLHFLQNKSLALFVDSLDTGRDPGSISLVDLNETAYPFFGSHNIPLRIIIESGPDAPRTFLLGIQPGNLDFGEMLSREVQEARGVIVRELSGIVRALGDESNGA